MTKPIKKVNSVIDTHETLVLMLRNPETPIESIRDYLMEEDIKLASIYVIVGKCGAYSDMTSWIAAAFLARKHAEDYLEILQREIGVYCKVYTEAYAKIDEVIPPPHPLLHALDPHLPVSHYDHSTAEYEIEEVLLRGDRLPPGSILDRIKSV